MTNAERDEILIALVKGVNNLQIIVKEMSIKIDDNKNELLNKIEENSRKIDENRKLIEENSKKIEDNKELINVNSMKIEANKNTLLNKIEECKNEIRAEVVDAIKVVSKTSYERDEELKRRIIANENDIKEIKMAIVN